MSVSILKKNVELLEILAEGCRTHPAIRPEDRLSEIVPTGLQSGLPDNSLKSLMMTNR